MVKYFCDWCNQETLKYFGQANSQLKLFLRKPEEKKILKAEVIISLNGSYNQAHICLNCAVNLCRSGVLD